MHNMLGLQNKPWHQIPEKEKKKKKRAVWKALTSLNQYNYAVPRLQKIRSCELKEINIMLLFSLPNRR